MSSLKVENLSYRYGDDRILKEINLELSSGKWVSLVGPNGSGKTTLLKLIGGLLPASESHVSGQVLWNREDLLTRDVKRRAQVLTYLGGPIWIDFPIRVREFVLMGRLAEHSVFSSGSFHSLSRKEQYQLFAVLKECRIFDLKDRLYHELSEGQKQLACLAQVLFQNPKVLLLDESFSHLDLHHKAHMAKILTALKDHGRLIISVSHEINYALEYSDELILMKSGEVLTYGPTEKVFTKEQLEKLYPDPEINFQVGLTHGRPYVSFNGAPEESIR